MKIMFILASVMCGVAFSFLSIIYGVRQIPFVTQPEHEEKQGLATPMGAAPSISVFSGESSVIEDLKAALSSERELYNQKSEALRLKEQEIENMQGMITVLKKELNEIHQQVSDKIVTLEESEEANFKRLAEMFSKMEAESASSLLAGMEPRRAATILNLIEQRQAAGILTATVAQGDRGTKTAVEWSDMIRRMKNNAKKGQ